MALMRKDNDGARRIDGEGVYLRAAPAAAVPPPLARQAPEEPDEVDRLFRGGP